MDMLFTIVPVFIGIVFVLMIGGIIVHLLMFGTVFGLMAKRISDAAKEQAAMAAKPCNYCGATIPAAAPQCPSCGAMR